MSLSVTQSAANWFIEEMDVTSGDHVQFFVKLYGGIPTPLPDYYLGVQVGKDSRVGIKAELNGIIFYLKSEDSWFLENQKLTVDVVNDDISFEFS